MSAGIGCITYYKDLYRSLSLEGIWNAFAKWNFWIKNLNKTPLNFLKQSSQMNNFTVFFQFFIGI
jgi:hypothetical protein